MAIVGECRNQVLRVLASILKTSRLKIVLLWQSGCKAAATALILLAVANRKNGDEAAIMKAYEALSRPAEDR
jgi:hypothetical protein